MKKFVCILLCLGFIGLIGFPFDLQASDTCGDAIKRCYGDINYGIGYFAIADVTIGILNCVRGYVFCIQYFSQ